MVLHDTIGPVLVVAAHPDDIEYAVAGTLLKYRGKLEPYFLIMTCGGENDPTSGPKRILEARDALSVFGKERLIVNNCIGVTYEKYPEHVATIEEVIETIQPAVIMTHSIHDTHQDHRLVTEMTVTASRRLKVGILFYPLLSSTPEFKPDIYVDVTGQMSQKRAMLAMHESQSEKPYMHEEYIDLFNSDPYARLHGIRFTERFAVGRLFA